MSFPLILAVLSTYALVSGKEPGATFWSVSAFLFLLASFTGED